MNLTNAISVKIMERFYENECTNPCCWCHSCYLIDANKVFEKAEELKISVTDVINLIKECNR